MPSGERSQMTARARSVAELYDELTAGMTRSLRLEELVYAIAELAPELVPTREQMAGKQGLELAQGDLLADVLALPEQGRHLLDAMREPTALALERLEEFKRTGVADLGAARVTRHGRAGLLELRNPRHLNAEDGTTL